MGRFRDCVREEQSPSVVAAAVANQESQAPEKQQRAGCCPRGTIGMRISRTMQPSRQAWRDSSVRGIGIAGSRPSGRSLSGNAIVARVARSAQAHC